MLIWRPPMKKARLRMFENRPMKTYKMTTNAIKWRIIDEKDTDDTLLSSDKLKVVVQR